MISYSFTYPWLASSVIIVRKTFINLKLIWKGHLKTLNNNFDNKNRKNNNYVDALIDSLRNLPTR